MIASTVELALYALMIVLPLLGWVMLSAKGEVIPSTFSSVYTRSPRSSITTCGETTRDGG